MQIRRQPEIGKKGFRSSVSKSVFLENRECNWANTTTVKNKQYKLYTCQLFTNSFEGKYLDMFEVR